MTPDDLWPSLETDSLSLAPGDLVARRIYAESVCDIRLAVGAPHSNRMLLVMLDQKHLPLNVELPVAKGFEAQRVSIPTESAGKIGVAIMLTDPAYRDVFSTLVQDVAELLSHLKDEAPAFRTLVNRLRIWQGFMQKAGLQGLDIAEQIGLYGELRFLRDQLIPRLGPEKAVAAWTGPDGTPQDFQCGTSATEIKTTAAGHHLVRISNALQLDGTTIDDLFLVHYSVDRRNAHGQTLVELVELVRSTLATSHEASELFAARLLQIGYHDAHAQQYHQSGYSDREWHTYRVRDGFPRILLSELLPGLQDVTYAIQVSALIPFEVPVGHLLDTLRPAPK